MPGPTPDRPAPRPLVEELNAQGAGVNLSPKLSKQLARRPRVAAGVAHKAPDLPAMLRAFREADAAPAPEVSSSPRSGRRGPGACP